MSSGIRGIGRFGVEMLDVKDVQRAMAFSSGVLEESFGASDQPTFRQATFAPCLNVVSQQVPKAKAGKNRVHVDIEVDNLKLGPSAVLVLGGSFVREVNNGQGGSLVCADPDEDELCLMLP